MATAAPSFSLEALLADVAALPAPSPLDVLLAAIPMLPRAVLSRLTARMVERLDEIDGDGEDEAEEDCCSAGDDDPRGEAVYISDGLPGDPEDADRAAWLERIDQTLSPYPFAVSSDYRNGEDAEDDDAAEDNNDAEAEQGFAAPHYGPDETLGPLNAWGKPPAGWGVGS